MIKIKTGKAVNFSSKYSAFIIFNYDETIITKIRQLPFRYFLPESKEWEIPIIEIPEALNVLNEYEIDVIDEYGVLDEKKLPDSFSFKTKPYQHQEIGVLYGINNDKWFLGDEQGLGKTKTVIDTAVARKQLYGYKHCLIVCGVNTLKWNWVNEILTHSNEDCYILGQKKLKNGTVKVGSTNDKLKDLKFLLEYETSTYFLITNIESFRDKAISDTIKKLCDKGIINMIAADEMHKMKNPTSQQTKGFLKCKAECQIGMTGTPLMNNPLDLYVILKWLGYEKRAFYSFKNEYCIMGGYGGHEVVGYINMPILQNQIKTIMLRRLKDDVLDLPDKLYVDEYVEMGGKQLVLYNEVKNGIKSALANGEIDLTNPLSALIRMRQATGYPGIISDTVFDSAKLDRMEDIVEETVANGQKCLIFSNWTQMTDIAYDRLLAKGFVGKLITGDTKDEQRQLIVDAFQNSNYEDFIIGTIGAMGTGLTLTAATVIIFVDEPWNKALYDQAVDRAHRIGQKNNITIYNLLTKDTIDEKIHKLIYKKGLMSDYIIDGRVVGDKTKLFNYLLN